MFRKVKKLAQSHRARKLCNWDLNTKLYQSKCGYQCLFAVLVMMCSSRCSRTNFSEYIWILPDMEVQKEEKGFHNTRICKTMAVGSSWKTSASFQTERLMYSMTHFLPQ